MTTSCPGAGLRSPLQCLHIAQPHRLRQPVQRVARRDELLADVARVLDVASSFRMIGG